MTQDFDMDAFLAEVAKQPRKTYEEISAEQRDLNVAGKLTSGKGINHDVIRSLDVTEVAKIIRQVLRKAFIGFKFSVKVQRYAGGSSIHVGYSEAFAKSPAQVAKLEELLTGYQSRRFDGTTDSSSYTTAWLLPTGKAVPAYTGAFGTTPEVDHPNPGGAELVSLGSDYVMLQKTYGL